MPKCRKGQTDVGRLVFFPPFFCIFSRKLEACQNSAHILHTAKYVYFASFFNEFFSEDVSNEIEDACFSGSPRPFGPRDDARVFVIASEAQQSRIFHARRVYPFVRQCSALFFDHHFIIFGDVKVS